MLAEVLTLALCVAVCVTVYVVARALAAPCESFAQLQPYASLPSWCASRKFVATVDPIDDMTACALAPRLCVDGKFVGGNALAALSLDHIACHGQSRCLLDGVPDTLGRCKVSINGVDMKLMRDCAVYGVRSVTPTGMTLVISDATWQLLTRRVLFVKTANGVLYALSPREYTSDGLSYVTYLDYRSRVFATVPGDFQTKSLTFDVIAQDSKTSITPSLQDECKKLRASQKDVVLKLPLVSYYYASYARGVKTSSAAVVASTNDASVFGSAWRSSGGAFTVWFDVSVDYGITTEFTFLYLQDVASSNSLGAMPPCVTPDEFPFRVLFPTITDASKLKYDHDAYYVLEVHAGCGTALRTTKVYVQFQVQTHVCIACSADTTWVTTYDANERRCAYGVRNCSAPAISTAKDYKLMVNNNFIDNSHSVNFRLGQVSFAIGDTNLDPLKVQ